MCNDILNVEIGEASTELQSHNARLADNLAMIFPRSEQCKNFYSRLNHDKHSICAQNKFYSEQEFTGMVQRNPEKLL